VKRKGFHDMNVVIEIEIDDQSRAFEVIELSEDQTVREVLSLAAAKAGIELEELLLDITAGEIQLAADSRLREIAHHGHRWKHRRVCIDLHFEADEKRHHFPTCAKWAAVHRWGCHHFRVAPDLCANLELREGEPKGPVLNEQQPIGIFHGCKTIWLVKPGPEPYGRG
jgi:hypothetical protein